MLYGLVSSRLPFHIPNDALNEHNVHVAYKLIAHSELKFEGPEWQEVSPALIGLLTGMLEKDPRTRLNADAVLRHPWMQNSVSSSNTSLIMPIRRFTNESSKSRP